MVVEMERLSMSRTDESRLVTPALRLSARCRTQRGRKDRGVGGQRSSRRAQGALASVLTGAVPNSIGSAVLSVLGEHSG